MDTSCKKCKAAITPPPKPKGTSPIATMKMTITGYRCEKCGHWNDLKRRKGFAEYMEKRA
ncbi:MAG: hypothetical protein H6R01_1044 [Burkholderiaceae bacterium]|nr:hypothetical protein [Burkholderiaceae bacterium]